MWVGEREGGGGEGEGGREGGKMDGFWGIKRRKEVIEVGLVVCMFVNERDIEREK